MDVKEHYLKNQVSGATQEQLLCMLLEGGEKFIRLGIKAFDADDIEDIHNNVIKAQNVYLELFCSLDAEAGDFVQHLHGLYYFMINNLTEANLKKDRQILENCLKISQDLTMMWKEAIDKSYDEKKPLQKEISENSIKSIDCRG